MMPARQQSLGSLWGRIIGQKGEGFDLFLITVMIAGNIIQVSSLFPTSGDIVKRASMAMQYVIVAFYTFKSYERGDVKAALFVILYLAYAIFLCFRFSALSGQAVNLNSALAYATICIMIAFWHGRQNLSRILNIFIICSFIYCALYLVFYNSIVSNGDVNSTVLSATEGRDTRVFLAGSFAALLVFCGIALLRNRFVFGMLLIAVGGAAILRAQSRMFEFILVIFLIKATIEVVIPKLRPLFALLLSAVFIMISAVMAAGLFVRGWNPYDFLAGDSSGLARFYEYEDAARIMSGNMLLGVGIPGSYDAMQNFVRPFRPFFTADIGLTGHAVTFGVPFAVLLGYITVRCIAAVPQGVGRDNPLFVGFCSTVQFCGFASFFSLNFFGGSGTLFCAIAFPLIFRRPDIYAAGWPVSATRRSYQVRSHIA